MVHFSPLAASRHPNIVSHVHIRKRHAHTTQRTPRTHAHTHPMPTSLASARRILQPSLPSVTHLLQRACSFAHATFARRTWQPRSKLHVHEDEPPQPLIGSCLALKPRGTRNPTQDAWLRTGPQRPQLFATSLLACKWRRWCFACISSYLKERQCRMSRWLVWAALGTGWWAFDVAKRVA